MEYLMKLNGSQILIESLLEQGVDTIFGYPGGAVLNIYDAIYSYQDKLKHVLTAHEQGAAHAADGYARATGKVGVVWRRRVPERPISLPVSLRRLWTACRWWRLRVT